mmetsp:Transcript_12355/g.25098  ORF Transcript_12355/g.25098 Transcript_12355/m.25098 type:complete len:81 (+) Transcript_12355:31-273(+)
MDELQEDPSAYTIEARTSTIESTSAETVVCFDTTINRNTADEAGANATGNNKLNYVGNSEFFFSDCAEVEEEFLIKMTTT